MQIGFAAVDALALARIPSATALAKERKLAWKPVAYSHAVELLDHNIAGILGRAQSNDFVYL